MKHLRLYEEFTNKDIEIGDYVVIYPPKTKFGVIASEQQKYEEFLKNNIGVVVNVNNVHNNIKVKYNDVSFFIKRLFYSDDTIMIHPQFVKYVGKTPEEVKIQAEAGKYNI